MTPRSAEGGKVSSVHARTLSIPLEKPLAFATRRVARREYTLAEALHDYRSWLQENRSTMAGAYVVGRPAFEWYVQRVLMFPYDSDQLDAIRPSGAGPRSHGVLMSEAALAQLTEEQ